MTESQRKEILLEIYDFQMKLKKENHLQIKMSISEIQSMLLKFLDQDNGNFTR